MHADKQAHKCKTIQQKYYHITKHERNINLFPPALLPPCVAVRCWFLARSGGSPALSFSLASNRYRPDPYSLSNCMIAVVVMTLNDQGTYLCIRKGERGAEERIRLQNCIYATHSGQLFHLHTWTLSLVPTPYPMYLIQF